MTSSLQKNFSSMASLMPFLRASLRQRMMRRLATVGKDKDGWKKADEHLTILMDQEHMIVPLRTLMQLSNDASNTYNVLPLMRDLSRPRFLRLRWRSRDKIPRLNLLHSRRLPKLRTPRSRRSRRSCARHIGCQACTQRRSSGQEAYLSVHCVWQTGTQCRGLFGQVRRRPSQARCGQG